MPRDPGPPPDPPPNIAQILGRSLAAPRATRIMCAFARDTDWLNVADATVAQRPDEEGERPATMRVRLGALKGDPPPPRDPAWPKLAMRNASVELDYERALYLWRWLEGWLTAYEHTHRPPGAPPPDVDGLRPEVPAEPKERKL